MHIHMFIDQNLSRLSESFTISAPGRGVEVSWKRDAIRNIDANSRFTSGSVQPQSCHYVNGDECNSGLSLELAKNCKQVNKVERGDSKSSTTDAIDAYLNYGELCPKFCKEAANRKMCCRTTDFTYFDNVKTLNPMKLMRFYSMLDDFEFLDIPLEHLLRRMKTTGITKKFVRAHVGDFPFSILITHMFSGEQQYMLQNTYITPELIIWFANPEVENIFLFGKKKKRPGGKWIFTSEDDHTWIPSYFSREYLQSQECVESFVIFKFKDVIYAIDMNVWLENIDNNENFNVWTENFNEYEPDLSDSHDENVVPKTIHSPLWTRFSDDLKCKSCNHIGHSESMCFLSQPKSLDIILKTMQNEKDINKTLPSPKSFMSSGSPPQKYVPRTQKERDAEIANMNRIDELNKTTVIKKETRQTKSQNLVNESLKYDFDDLPMNYSHSSGLRKNLTIEETAKLFGKEWKLDDISSNSDVIAAIDAIELKLEGKHDNELQLQYNISRDKLIKIIGTLPKIENYKLPDFTNFTISSIVFTLITVMGLSILPAIGIASGTLALLPKNVIPRDGHRNFFVAILANCYNNVSKYTNINTYLKEQQTWEYLQSDSRMEYDLRPDGDRRTILYQSQPRNSKFSVSTELKFKSKSVSALASKFKNFLPTMFASLLNKFNSKHFKDPKTVSLEIASQTLVKGVAPLNFDQDLCVSRIHKSINTLQGVNYDKDGLLYGENVIGDTTKFCIILDSHLKKKNKTALLSRKENYRRISRGYRVGEVPLPKLPKFDSTTFIDVKKRDLDATRRPALSSEMFVKFPYKKPQPDREDVNTLISGLNKRIGMEVPEPPIETLADLTEFNRTVMRELLKPVPRTADTSIRTWAESTTYNSDRKTKLIKLRDDISDIYNLSYRKLGGFIKDEDYVDYKYPRGIYSRSDEFKVIVGPFVKLMENIVYKLPYFIKHVPVAQRAAVIAEMVLLGAKYMSSDYNSYESHFKPKVMEALEFQLYDYLLCEVEGGSDISKLLRETLAGTNVIKFKNLDLYVEARRMSGEMTTSLANGWSNLICTLFILHKHGVDWRTVAMKVEGDDGLTRIDTYVPTEDDFKNLGFSIKIEIFDSINEASFCGMVYDPDECIVIKNPIDVICGLFWTNLKYVNASDKVMMSLLRCKALSLLYSYPGCPILSSVSKWLCNATEGYDVNTGILDGNHMTQIFNLNQDYYTKHKSDFHKETGPNTRDLVAKKYGISIFDQLYIENYFNNKVGLGPIECLALEAYCPKQYSDFYNQYTEIVDISVETEMLYSVKHYPYVSEWDHTCLPEENTLKYGLKNKILTAVDGNIIRFTSKPLCLVNAIVEDVVESDDSDEPGFTFFDGMPVIDIDDVPTNMKPQETDRLFAFNLLKPTSASIKMNALTIGEKFIDIIFGNRVVKPVMDFCFEKIILNVALPTVYWVWNAFRNKFFPQKIKIIVEEDPIIIYDVIDQGDDLKKTLVNRLRGGFNSSLGTTIKGQLENKGFFQNHNNNMLVRRNNNNQNRKVMPRRAIKRNGLNGRVSVNSRAPNGNLVRNVVRKGNLRRNIKNGRTFDGLPSTQRFTPPRQMTSNNKSRIIHREPLATVLGSVGFNIQTFEVNPGLASTFPWLSAQAAGYESYKINSLAVEYRFTTNEFIGLGRIVIAPDYDATDAAPTTITQGEQMTDSVMGAVAKNWTCNLRPRGMGILGPKRYVRTGTLAANEDKKTYDIAQIHIITQGQSDTAEIGQLWLSYDISLTEPQPVSEANFFAVGTLYNDPGTGSLTTDILGDDPVAEGSIVISKLLNVVSVRNLIVTRRYRATLQIVAGVLATSGTVTCTSNCIDMNNSDMGNKVYVVGTTESIVVRDFVPSQSLVTLTLGGYTTITNPSKVLFTVAPMNNLSD